MCSVKDERDLMCSKRSDKNIACRGEGKHLAKNIVKHSVTFHKQYFYYTSSYVIYMHVYHDAWAYQRFRWCFIRITPLSECDMISSLIAQLLYRLQELVR